MRLRAKNSREPRGNDCGELLTGAWVQRIPQIIAELVPGQVHSTQAMHMGGGSGRGRWSSGGGGAAEPGVPGEDSPQGGWCIYCKEQGCKEQGLEGGSPPSPGQ